MGKTNTFKDKREYNKFVENIPFYLEFVKKILAKTELSFDENEAVKVSLYINDNELSEDGLLSLIAYFGEAIRYRYGGEWFFTGKNDGFEPNEASIGNSEAVLLRTCPRNYIKKIQETGDIHLFNDDLKEDLKNKNEIKDLMLELFPKRRK